MKNSNITDESLDINKYSDRELQGLFNINSPFNIRELKIKIEELRIKLINNPNHGMDKISKLSTFLDKSLERLLKNCSDVSSNSVNDNLRQIVQNTSTSADGTYLQAQNNVLQVGISHPVIQNQNELAGLNASTSEGRVVDSGEYPPGFLNPINIKVIKKAINIDTRFRPEYFNSKSTDFSFTLPDTFNRVVNMRLASLDFPATIYAISSARENTTFCVDVVTNPMTSWGYGFPCYEALCEKNIVGSKLIITESQWKDNNPGAINVNPWAEAQLKILDSFYRLLFNANESCIDDSTPLLSTPSISFEYNSQTINGWPLTDDDIITICSSPTSDWPELFFKLDIGTKVYEWITEFANTGPVPNTLWSKSFDINPTKEELAKFFIKNDSKYLDLTSSSFSIYPSSIEELGDFWRLFPSYSDVNKLLEIKKNISPLIPENEQVSYNNLPPPLTKLQIVNYFNIVFGFTHLTSYTYIPIINSSQKQKGPYSANPALWLWLPWRINNTKITIPSGNYNTVPSEAPNVPIGATINSQLYNVGLDPYYAICYSIDAVDGKSTFARPSTKYLYEDISITGESLSDPSGCFPTITNNKFKTIKPKNVQIPLQINQSKIPNIPFNSLSWPLGFPGSPYEDENGCSQGIPFVSSFLINFTVDVNGNKDLTNPIVLKLGWQLGFRFGSYGLSEVAISEGICQIIGPRYIFFCINDFTNASNNYFTAAFSDSIISPYILGKINYAATVEDNNYGVIEDDDFSSSVNRTREYFGPININKLQIQILDEYGRVVDLNNMDWSCALLFDILYD